MFSLFHRQTASIPRKHSRARFGFYDLIYCNRTLVCNMSAIARQGAIQPKRSIDISHLPMAVFGGCVIAIFMDYLHKY